MSNLYVALDIETCPLPRLGLSTSQEKRLVKEVRYHRRRKPNMGDQEISSMAQSLTPVLGWICCVSAVCAVIRREEVSWGQPRSWTAEAPEEEQELLVGFWETVRGFKPRATWVTFNGKRFDSPYIEARSTHRGVQTPSASLLNTHPYRHNGHIDLATLWRFHYGLEDLCGMLGVQSPKQGFDGSMVAGAVEEGRIEEVAAYCENDTVATLECFLAAERTMQL